MSQVLPKRGGMTITKLLRETLIKLVRENTQIIVIKRNFIPPYRRRSKTNLPIEERISNQRPLLLRKLYLHLNKKERLTIQ